MADPVPPAAAPLVDVEHVDVLPSIPGYYTWPGLPSYKGARRVKWRKRQNKRYVDALAKKTNDDAKRQAASSTPTTTSIDAPPAATRTALTPPPSERYTDARSQRARTATTQHAAVTSPPPSHQGGGEISPASSAAETNSALTTTDLLSTIMPPPAPPRQPPTNSGASQTASNEGTTPVPRSTSVIDGPPPTSRRPARESIADAPRAGTGRSPGTSTPARESIADTPRAGTGRSPGASTFSPTTARAWRRVQHKLARQLTPERARFVKALADEPCIASNPTIAAHFFGKANSILRKHQSPATPASTPSSDDPIDEDAFNYHHPSRKGGRHRGRRATHRTICWRTRRGRGREPLIK